MRVGAQIPNAETTILLTDGSSKQASDKPSLVLVVDDVADTYGELRAKGLTFVQEPTSAPWSNGRTFSLLRDPDGNVVLIGEES
jgi:catechol 2,3-dioxygenase-like lactoylglutathione lyase family enzyme